ncbi:MAG: hypothetical protein NT062_29775 [Proteobacteria bacterium]|nr:hypothetical protein [Pseudomonadota bacterium]
MMKTSLLTIVAISSLSSMAFADKRPVTQAAAKVVASAPTMLKTPKLAKAAAPKVVAPLATDLSITEIDTNLEFGKSYEILDRSHDLKDAKVEESSLKIKAESGIGQAPITASRLADLEYCWDRMPAARRAADTTAVVKLAIEPIGSVAIATVTGDMHPELRKCIVAAAGRWRFPVADDATEVEYAVALKTTVLNK